MRLVPVSEWLGRRPRADVRILELEPTGALIQNQGTKPCRCGITATVGDVDVECSPAIVDLLPNQPPRRIRIHVPEPPPSGELTLSVNDGKRLTSASVSLPSAGG
jgi:hypothetical protein